MRIFTTIFVLFHFISLGQTKTADTTTERKIDLYAKSFNDTLQGKPFIDFSTTLLSGDSFKLSDHRGKVILLNFWEIGCAPCMGEISDINKIYKTYKDSGVVVLSLARNSASQLNKFNQGRYSRPTEPIQYPIVPDSKPILTSYNVTGYPTSILIDKQGVIRLVYAGASPHSLKQYVEFYGDKNLSKEWKKVLKQIENDKSPAMSEILAQLIDDLLKEK